LAIPADPESGGVTSGDDDTFKDIAPAETGSVPTKIELEP